MKKRTFDLLEAFRKFRPVRVTTRRAMFTLCVAAVVLVIALTGVGSQLAKQSNIGYGEGYAAGVRDGRTAVVQELVSPPGLWAAFSGFAAARVHVWAPALFFAVLMSWVLHGFGLRLFA